MEQESEDRQALLHELVRDQRERVAACQDALAEARRSHARRKLRLELLAAHDLADDQDELELDGLIDVLHEAERVFDRQQRILAVIESAALGR
jgi:hypothetical protein